jgi:hypothetical protein
MFDPDERHPIPKTYKVTGTMSVPFCVTITLNDGDDEEQAVCDALGNGVTADDIDIQSMDETD